MIPIFYIIILQLLSVFLMWLLLKSFTIYDCKSTRKIKKCDIIDNGSIYNIKRMNYDIRKLINMTTREQIFTKDFDKKLVASYRESFKRIVSEIKQSRKDLNFDKIDEFLDSDEEIKSDKFISELNKLVAELL